MWSPFDDAPPEVNMAIYAEAPGSTGIQAGLDERARQCILAGGGFDPANNRCCGKDSDGLIDCRYGDPLEEKEALERYKQSEAAGDRNRNMALLVGTLGVLGLLGGLMWWRAQPTPQEV